MLELILLISQQTSVSTGKTHTMGGHIALHDSEEVKGIIPRAVADIFALADEVSNVIMTFTCPFINLRCRS